MTKEWSFDSHMTQEIFVISSIHSDSGIQPTFNSVSNGESFLRGKVTGR
jgi:hypothetical protein